MERRVSPSAKHDFAAVIMAAGIGTRMKNPNLAKVMYEINGKPMIHYVVDLAYDLHASRIIVIVGYQREVVSAYIRKTHPDVECVVQDPQLGTGHAVLQSESSLKSFLGNVLVLSGDVPLLKKETMQRVMAHHADTNAVATILTADMDDPTGYGRIVRNPDRSVKKIVEQKDATPEELAIREMNSGIYMFNKERLFDGLNHIGAHNVQNEYYLTDVFEYFWKRHWTISALKASQVDEIRGVNTVHQLEEAKAVVESRS